MDETTNHLLDITWAAEYAGFTRPALTTNAVFERIVKPHMLQLLQDDVLWAVLWPLHVDINHHGDTHDEVFYEDQFGNALRSVCRPDVFGKHVITIMLAGEHPSVSS